MAGAQISKPFKTILILTFMNKIDLTYSLLLAYESQLKLLRRVFLGVFIRTIFTVYNFFK